MMSQIANLLQDPMQPVQMAHDSYSRSMRSKTHRLSPGSVKVPKLDLPLPPASPRRRGSTAAYDEMQSFMPLTPAPITPRLAPASAASLLYSPHFPNPSSIVDQSSPAVHQVLSQDADAPAGKMNTRLRRDSQAEQSAPKAHDNSQKASQPASTIGTPAAVEGASNNGQNQTADQPWLRANTPAYPAGSLHQRAMKSPDGSKSYPPKSPRSLRLPASAATSELSQVIPRSWNGTPTVLRLRQADATTFAGRQSDAAAEAGGPGALVDGEHTLQQVLARNEVCTVPQNLSQDVQSLLTIRTGLAAFMPVQLEGANEAELSLLRHDLRHWP